MKIIIFLLCTMAKKNISKKKFCTRPKKAMRKTRKSRGKNKTSRRKNGRKYKSKTMKGGSYPGPGWELDQSDGAQRAWDNSQVAIYVNPEYKGIHCSVYPNGKDIHCKKKGKQVMGFVCTPKAKGGDGERRWEERQRGTLVYNAYQSFGGPWPN